MREKKTSTPRSTQNTGEWKFFFQYPVFKQASSPTDSIQLFRDEFEELAHGGFSKERFSSEKSIKIAKERFKKASENIGKVYIKCQNIDGFDEDELTFLKEKQELYLYYSMNWSPEENIELVKVFYARALDILEAYVKAYKDCILRETDGKESKLVPIVKKQAQPLANRLNKKVVWKSRIKTWRSFLRKLVLRMESLDITELDRFYDIYGSSFTILEKNPEGIESCYRLANMLLKYLKEDDFELLPPRYVGPTDSRIKEPYLCFVKDYYKNPKKTKYKALHISAKGSVGDFQFTMEYHISAGVDEFAANSKVGHKNYKKQSEIDISSIVDFTKIHYDEFEYAYDPVTGEEHVMDYAGFIEPKWLTKTKVFRPIGR